MTTRFPRVTDPNGLPVVEGVDGLAYVGGRPRQEVLGVLDLLDLDSLEPVLRRELETFETLPVTGQCYFRQAFLREAAQEVSSWLGGGGALSVVEIGGGEGYFARAFKEQNPQGDAYVCDLSLTHLCLAPDNLIRLRCDARKPYLAPTTVDVAAFWVSLHHFPEADMRAAIEQASLCLKPGGVVLVFEPNAGFFPRHMLLATPLRSLVYYDDAEKPVSLFEMTPMFEKYGLSLAAATTTNPPYNYDFLRHLPGGVLFYPFVQACYGMERALVRPLSARLKRSGFSVRLGSYIFALYQSRRSLRESHSDNVPLCLVDMPR